MREIKRFDLHLFFQQIKKVGEIVTIEGLEYNPIIDYIDYFNDNDSYVCDTDDESDDDDDDDGDENGDEDEDDNDNDDNMSVFFFKS